MKSISNIILADDDIEDQELFMSALQEIGLDLKLTAVSDGVELINLLNETNFIQPDLIFLDLNMPLKTGFECLTEMKNEPKLQKIPVIVLSASNDSRHIDQVYQDNAHYYICKPNTFDKLKSAIALSLSTIANEENTRVSKDGFVLNHRLQ